MLMKDTLLGGRSVNYTVDEMYNSEIFSFWNDQKKVLKPRRRKECLAS